MKNNKMKNILSLVLVSLLGIALAVPIQSNLHFSSAMSLTIGMISMFSFAMFNTYLRKQNVFAAITFTGPASFTDSVYEEILNDIYLLNDTVGKGYVRFVDSVKSTGRVRAMTVTVTSQAYSNSPTAAGTILVEERAITPVKKESYNTFDYETIRVSSFSETMMPGAANIISDPFTQKLIGNVGPKLSKLAESEFWNSITSGTQTAIAALTANAAQTSVGAAEKTYAASLTAGLTDGVVTKLIYNDAVTQGTYAVGKRYKVVGTTLSATNIQDEIDKVYAQIDDALLTPENIGRCKIFIPNNVVKFINQANTVVTAYQIVFIKGANGNFTYNDVELCPVPLPSNCMIAGCGDDICWVTDLVDDVNQVLVDKLPAPAKNFFFDIVYTQESWIFYMSAKVLYLG